MRAHNIILTFGIVVILAGFLASYATAQTAVIDPAPAFGGSFQMTISVITGWLANLALPLGTVFIVFASFKFITSRGSEQKVTEGKKALTYAVIGIFLMILGFGLICVIVNILGMLPPPQC